MEHMTYICDCNFFVHTSHWFLYHIHAIPVKCDVHLKSGVTFFTHTPSVSARINVLGPFALFLPALPLSCSSYRGGLLPSLSLSASLFSLCSHWNSFSRYHWLIVTIPTPHYASVLTTSPHLCFPHFQISVFSKTKKEKLHYRSDLLIGLTSFSIFVLVLDLVIILWTNNVGLFQETAAVRVPH